MNIITEQSKKQALEIEILKSHLRIEHEHEDTYLKEIISMATDILEKNIEKPILNKTYRYIFHNNEFVSSKKIMIPINHVNSVISVRKIINDKCSEEVSYTVKNYNDKTAIITNGSKYPIEIKYIAGITEDEKEIPKDLQFAILQIAKNIYECSEEDVLESKYIKHIINSNRTLNID